MAFTRSLKQTAGDLDTLSERLVTGIKQEASRAFYADVAGAVRALEEVRAGRPDALSIAEYVDPTFASGAIRPEVPFPTTERAAFYLIARPIDNDGNHSDRVNCGVPMLIGDQVPLEESGLLERPLGTFRVGKDTDVETDKLVGIVRGMHEGSITRLHQDLFLQGMTWGDLLHAYEKEKAGSFAQVPVQRVTVLIPRNSAYTTEVIPIVAYDPLFGSEEKALCIGYGIGERGYRGRPILQPGKNKTAPLLDVNEQGMNAWHAIQGLAEAQADSVRDYTPGNLVAIALPLVGEKPVSIFDRYSGYSGGFHGGGALREATTFKQSFGRIDAASFGTGRSTGTASKLVSGDFDPGRPKAILDITTLTYTPGNVAAVVEQYLN